MLLSNTPWRLPSTSLPKYHSQSSCHIIRRHTTYTVYPSVVYLTTLTAFQFMASNCRMNNFGITGFLDVSETGFFRPRVRGWEIPTVLGH
jgi:hypothetical protein